jgi:hypothetical protein
MQKPEYKPQITLGNLLTILGVIASVVGFFMKYHDRLLIVEAAQISSSQREMEFKREVLQRLADLQVDVREIRQSNGVKWRELPPSPYNR